MISIKKNQKQNLKNLASERTRYTRANPDPDPPPVYENPNLIPRILCQESYVIPMFRFHSCPVVFEYLEDLPFDENFKLSLFETKSESAVGATVLNPEFVKDLETKRAKRSIEDYILNLQTSIVATNIPEFLESTSATLGSSVVVFSLEIPTKTPLIPTIPM